MLYEFVSFKLNGTTSHHSGMLAAIRVRVRSISITTREINPRLFELRHSNLARLN